MLCNAKAYYIMYNGALEITGFEQLLDVVYTMDFNNETELQFNKSSHLDFLSVTKAIRL